jgi:putative copper resistance protein D
MDNFLYLPRALAASIFDLAFAVAFGCLLAVLWLRPGTDARRSERRELTPDRPLQADRTHSRYPSEPLYFTLLRRTLTLCAAAMLLVLPVQLWLLTASMVGSSSTPEIRSALRDVLTATHAGRVLMPDFACALLLFAVSFPRRRAGAYAALAIAFTLAAFRSASGHAASNGNFSRGELVQFLHLTSIAIWAGAVMVAGLLVLPRLTDLEEATRFGRRLSGAATVAIVVVGLSGIYNAWIGLDGSLQPLPRTQWGILLLVKSALVLAALAFGAANRFALARNPVLTPADKLRFTRSMRLEALVMIAILGISGFLANSPPASGM